MKPGPCACGCTLVYGTNPLTGETRDIPHFTGQRLSIRLQGEEGHEKLVFEVENLTPADLPEDVLRLYRHNPDMLQRACQDTGWNLAEVQKRIAELPETADAEQASAAAPETLLGSANVRITLDSGITDYNSRPLTDAEAHFAPVELEPTITVRATGSQTAVGSSSAAQRSRPSALLMLLMLFFPFLSTQAHALPAVQITLENGHILAVHRAVAVCFLFIGA